MKYHMFGEKNYEIQFNIFGGKKPMKYQTTYFLRKTYEIPYICW